MKINISGHHVDVTEAVRAHINEKFSKIASHFPSLISLDIILSKEHNKYQAEISTTYEGARLSVKAEDDVMYPAIAGAAKKLDASHACSNCIMTCRHAHRIYALGDRSGHTHG